MVFFCVLKVKVIYDSFIYETRWWQGETDLSIDIMLFKRIKEWMAKHAPCAEASQAQRQMSVTGHQQFGIDTDSPMHGVEWSDETREAVVREGAVDRS